MEKLYYDSLTNILNRDGMKKEFSNFSNQNNGYFIFLDIDNFKYCNDTFGHDIGDKILEYFVRRMENILPKNALFGRNYGDEFLMVIPDNIEKYLNIIIMKMKIPFSANGNIIEISTSIGAVEFPKYSKDFEQLTKFSDIAMYNAKKLGKNQYSIFDHQMFANYHNKQKYKLQIINAIETKAIKLSLVSRVKSTNNLTSLHSYSVRLMWLDNGEVLSEDLLKDIIQELSLQTTFNRYILNQIIDILKSWKKENIPIYDISCELNITSIQDIYLMDKVLKRLDVLNINKETIVYRISPTDLINLKEGKKRIYKELKSKNFPIEIDDGINLRFDSLIDSGLNIKNIIITEKYLTKKLEKLILFFKEEFNCDFIISDYKKIKNEIIYVAKK